MQLLSSRALTTSLLFDWMRKSVLQLFDGATIHVRELWSGQVTHQVEESLRSALDDAGNFPDTVVATQR